MKAIILLSLVILLLSACSTKGDLKIINETEHNVYFSINNIDKTLQANQTTVLSLDSGKDYSPFYRPEKEYNLKIKGETFSLYDGITPLDETTVTVTSKKTKRLYLQPTDAGIKVNNNSLSHSLYNVGYQKIYPDTTTELTILTNEILPQTTWFSILPYFSQQDSFAFKFSYETYTGTIVYSDTTTLHLDEQFIIDYTN